MPKKQYSDSESRDALDDWLKAAGFAFNPFEALEASQDIHLSKYMIEHSDFANAWGNWPNIVGAPAGGGKTALRIRLTQACYAGGDFNRPFPVNYVIPFFKFGDQPARYDDHLSEIINKAGVYLLIFLTNRPHRYLQLDDKDKQQVNRAISLSLPGSITTYIEPCITSNNLDYLYTLVPPSIIPPVQDKKASMEFLHTLQKTKQDEYSDSSLIEKWELLVNVLIRVLKFQNIYLFIDGIDASPTTSTNEETGIKYIAPLLEKIDIFRAAGIHLKFFIPSEICNVLENQYKNLIDETHITKINWDQSNLADLIRRRVFAASEGAFGSLQPFCSPAISEIEMQISKNILPLPREMILFTRQLLINHVNGKSELLQSATLNNTIKWYQKLSN